jgi:CubicO group peptidase (beta-lactamase class C family)
MTIKTAGYASAATIALISVLAIPSAHADALFRSVTVLPADVTSTPISGFDASRQTIKEPGNSAILSGLEFDEVGDQPCFIRSHWWRSTTDDVDQEFTTDFDICAQRVDGDQSIVFSNARETRTGVRAIQVCNTGQSNHRVKGVKLFGAFVDQDQNGTVVSSGTTRSFERTNCKEPWQAVRACTSGEVAVGLVIEHTNDEVTGLGLRCAPVRVQSVMVDSNPATLFNEMERDIRVQVDAAGKIETMTIAQAIERHEVAGATVVVIDNGEVAVVRHYGMRNAKDDLRTNGDTIYQAASISKLFGALAMAKAARLSHGPTLDQTAQRTANANPDSLIARWVDKKFDRDEESYPAEITVRRLMGHTAGLSNWGIGNSKSDNETELETILMGDPFTDSTKPRVRPGTDWCYSGGGVSAAEAMFEIHAGCKARDFLNEEILTAYGLTKSTFNDASDSMSNLARGCSRGLCSTKPKHTEAKFAGGMLANPEEYARVLTYLMNDGKDRTGRQIIPLADVQAILTPTYHRSSSLRACTASSACASGETCVIGRCMTPLEAACDGSGSWWYGMGTYLSKNVPFGPGGYPRSIYHGGANPDGDSATRFEADRQTRRGVVIMVNGEYTWTKKGVEYGANALVNDIAAAFSRHFQ